MNILIVKLSALGDCVHTLPALSLLRRCYPRAHITWVVETAAADLIKDHPCLDRVLVSHRKQWLRELKGGHFGVLKEIAQFVGNLRGRPYDLVIDFHGLFKSSVLVWLSGGKRRLGYDSMQELSGLFVNEKIHEDMGKHAVDRYLDFIRYLSTKDHLSLQPQDGQEVGAAPEPVGEAEFLIPSTKKEEDRVAQLLKAQGLAGRRFVAVNPIAFWETKLWAEDKFAQLCDLLAEHYDVAVVFTGTEEEALRRIQTRMRTSCLNLAGKTSLRELAVLYRQAACVITTDSGPMHLAAAVGTPVVALFGPTDPRRTGPYGKDHVVVRKDLACRPCFLKKCTKKECMNLISVEEVLQAAGGILKAKVKRQK